jgi:hypothetical protein
MQTTYRKAWIILLAALLLGACTPLASEPSAPLIPGLAQTLAAQTLTVLDVQTKRYATPQPPQFDSGQIQAFDNLATGDPAGQPLTSASEEATPLPAEAQEEALPTPGCTNMAEFVRDITIPDNTKVDPNERFVKTWEFKNAGTCTWNGEYSIVFMWGEAMDGPSKVPIGQTVAPGETVKVSVSLTAPKYPQDYQGNWLFEDHTGRRFGTGYKGRKFFWVAISVGGGFGGAGGDGAGCLGGG